MTERRHILIVGAGAIGGLYAAALAKAADVAVLDTNRAHVQAIRQNGLRLTGCTESVTKLEAFASAAEMGKRRFGAAIILVKSQATEAAFESIRPGLEGRPLLATFQNGMGNEELLMRLMDLDVAHGVSFEAARYDGPGRVHHLVHGEDSWLGPARGKVESVRWLGELMTKSGLPTRVVADPRGRPGRERRALRGARDARADRRHGGGVRPRRGGARDQARVRSDVPREE